MVFENTSKNRLRDPRKGEVKQAADPLKVLIINCFLSLT